LLAFWGVAGTGPVRFRAPTDVAVDASSNLYVADTDNHRIAKLSPGGALLASWKGVSRNLYAPQGVAVDPRGNIYVADNQDSWIQKLSPAGTPLALWGGCRLPMEPDGVAVGKDGTIYLSGQVNGGFGVAAYPPSGGTPRLWKVSGFGPEHGVVYMSGPSIALDGHGDIYVPRQTPNFGVSKYSPAGVLLQSFVVPKRTSAHSLEITGVAVDSQGNVYASEVQWNTILKFSPAGALLATFGSTGKGPGQFKGVLGLDIDAQNNLYVPDAGNGRVQKLAPAGKPLAEWSAPEFAKSGGPFDVAVDGHGNLWVVLTGGVLALSPDGKVLEKWMQGQFIQPWGLTIDTAGNVYVTDISTSSVQKLNTGG